MMGILGIPNRTENWKTARYFSPFFRDKDARLSQTGEEASRRFFPVESPRILNRAKLVLSCFGKGCEITFVRMM